MFCYAVMTFKLAIFHCKMLTCNYGNFHSASIHSASINLACRSETKIVLPVKFFGVSLRNQNFTSDSERGLGKLNN